MYGKHISLLIWDSGRQVRCSLRLGDRDGEKPRVGKEEIISVTARETDWYIQQFQIRVMNWEDVLYMMSSNDKGCYPNNNRTFSHLLHRHSFMWRGLDISTKVNFKIPTAQRGLFACLLKCQLVWSEGSALTAWEWEWVAQRTYLLSFLPFCRKTSVLFIKEFLIKVVCKKIIKRGK